MQNVCVFTGARPNFVKVAPIVRAINKTEGIAYQLVYAGRQDDPTLEASLFDDLQMPKPDIYLGVDCENLNELTGRVMAEFENYLNHHSTDIVIVVDDLASTMAAAIVTKKRGVKLAHLVAGTRSFDINMPKEINRLVIDGLSDLLFTAGIGSNRNVGREGAEFSHVYMVGNILIDTLRYNHNRLTRPSMFDELNLKPKKYIVLTINRHALLANRENLKLMLHTIAAEAGGTPIIAPVRKTAYDIISNMMSDMKNLHLIEPQSYLGFCYLTTNAMGVVTDSGNVAEEATFNCVPCITLNSYTEHIETVTTGSNVLVGENAEILGKNIKLMVYGQWKNCSLPDRWDGRTAERIISILLDYEA